MKVDGGLSSDLARAPEAAAALEKQGYDGCWTGEINHDGSTPAYRKVLKLHGWGDVATELHRLSLQGEWDTMGSLIDDEMLDAFAVVAPVDKVATTLQSRCDGVIDRVLPIFTGILSKGTAAAVLRELRQ
jgi:hypothetical protein